MEANQINFIEGETSDMLIFDQIKIKQDENEYCLNIISKGEKITFSVNVKNQLLYDNYTRKISFNNIKELHKGFSTLRSFNDFYEYLKSLSDKEKLKIKKYNDKISLIIYLEVLFKPENVEIDLTPGKQDIDLNIKTISKELLNMKESDIKELHKKVNQEINNLKNKNEELNREIKDIKDKNTLLEKENKRINEVLIKENENKKFTKIINDIRNEINKLKNKDGNLEFKIQNKNLYIIIITIILILLCITFEIFFRKPLANINSKFDEQNKEINKLKKENKDVEDKIGEINEKINHLNDENKDIQNKINKLNKEINKLEKENKEVKDKISNLIEEINIIKKGNKDSKDKINDENEEINCLKEENKILNKIIEELRKKYIYPILNITSIIMDQNKTNEKYLILEEIEKRMDKKVKQINKLYQATTDGGDPINFHKKCDNITNTLVLIKSEGKRRFGGFTPIPWKSEGGGIEDHKNKTFVFSLDNEKIYSLKDISYSAVFHKINRGPEFGTDDINIKDNIIKENGLSIRQHSFDYKGDKNALSEHKTDSKALEYEVFQIEFY